MSSHHTPPHGGPTTPTITYPDSAIDKLQAVTATTPKRESPDSNTLVALCTQKDVDAKPAIKRIQQDLLILTSFNDNSSLCWRPSWFKEKFTPKPTWTLHNPPSVVTEALPNHGEGLLLYTRRMRRSDDPPPQYIKDWEHWIRYCNMHGIPDDFLCEEQIRLMRLGLPRAADGSIFRKL